MLPGAVSILVGIVIGIVVLNMARRSEMGGWLTLGLGLAALLFFALAGWLSRGIGEPAALWWISIACTAAALVAGLGAVSRGIRRWPFWAGLAAGAVPAIFWLVFIVGNILNPE